MIGMTGPDGRMVPVNIEFRAPGHENPATVPVERTPGTVTQPTSPVFEAPDVQNSPQALQRQRFLDTITTEDQDIRVLATALRLRGYSVKTIATGLDVPLARVRRVLRQSRQDGNLHDVLADLTTEALPLAVEKLIEAIDDGKAWAIQDTLKGLGAFRSYSHQDATVQRDERKLEVSFTLPTNVVPVVNPRGIVGAPREVLDATVHAVRVEEAGSLGPHE